MKVLLLSAYAAQSHVYWHENLKSMFADWDWQILTLPPRHFSWRVRGNPLYWSLRERELLSADYDLLIATSMVDLATLRGLVPELASLPAVLYFHENQFGYPQNQPQARSQNLLEAQMVSLYASLAADCIVFNSDYNQDTFLSGCDALLNKLPDKVPAGVVSALRAKSRVIPVPLKQTIITGEKGASRWRAQQSQFPERPLRILWVGRFEYDKGGDNLLLCLRALERQGLNYELAVVGQQFRNSPGAFSDIAEEFGHRLIQFGYIESRDEYQHTLAGADVVLSTAIHEFQGLAILEAVAAACLPAVPHRLVYPEILPAGNSYPSFPQDPIREAEGAAALVFRLADQIKSGCIEAPDVSRFSTRQLEPIYRDLFTSLSRSSQ
ncbi:MAG: DUF3524 domain-containing protein [Proteobacteria bacterium]|nr:DUF3524 domain-containing protein [Pseudomonadota bacterium]